MTVVAPATDEQSAHVRRLCRIARATHLEDLLAEVPPAEVTVILLRLQRTFPGSAPIPVFHAGGAT